MLDGCTENYINWSCPEKHLMSFAASLGKYSTVLEHRRGVPVKMILLAIQSIENASRGSCWSIPFSLFWLLLAISFFCLIPKACLSDCEKELFPGTVFEIKRWVLQLRRRFGVQVYSLVPMLSLEVYNLERGFESFILFASVSLRLICSVWWLKESAFVRSKNTNCINLTFICHYIRDERKRIKC